MNQRHRKWAAPIVQRGVYVSIPNGNDGVTAAILDVEAKLLKRGVLPGHSHSMGGPFRTYYGFVTEAAWPEVEAVLKRFGRIP